jgi:hypothetical protein
MERADVQNPIFCGNKFFVVVWRVIYDAVVLFGWWCYWRWGVGQICRVSGSIFRLNFEELSGRRNHMKLYNSSRRSGIIWSPLQAVNLLFVIVENKIIPGVVCMVLFSTITNNKFAAWRGDHIIPKRRLADLLGIEGWNFGGESLRPQIINFSLRVWNPLTFGPL